MYLKNFAQQVDQDLLSEEQSDIFIDMIRDIVKKVKDNPKQLPVVTIPPKYRQVSKLPINLNQSKRP
jgi:hypothetical protein